MTELLAGFLWSAAVATDLVWDDLDLMIALWVEANATEDATAEDSGR